MCTHGPSWPLLLQRAAPRLQSRGHSLSWPSAPKITFLAAEQQDSIPAARKASSSSVAPRENGWHQIYPLLPAELEAKSIGPSPESAWLSLPSRFVLYALWKQMKVLNNITWIVLEPKSLSESLTQECYTLCSETGANGGIHSLRRQEKEKKPQLVSVYL